MFRFTASIATLFRASSFLCSVSKPCSDPEYFQKYECPSGEPSVFAVYDEDHTLISIIVTSSPLAPAVNRNPMSSVQVQHSKLILALVSNVVLESSVKIPCSLPG